MKIIINESQLRLIIENEEGERLINFTGVYKSIHPSQWDDMFHHMDRKKGGGYSGYYINGDIDSRQGADLPLELYKDYMDDDYFDRDIDEDVEFGLNYLVKVDGYMDMRKTKINGLDKLKHVGRYLSLNSTEINSLPNLDHVGGGLGLMDTNINDLPKLKYVKGTLFVEGTPLANDIDKLRKIYDKLGKKMR